MSKIKVSIGRTYNLGNYNSLRLDVGLEDQLEYNDKVVNDYDFDAIYSRLKELLSKMEKDNGVGG
jgi:hypothetical protein